MRSGGVVTPSRGSVYSAATPATISTDQAQSAIHRWLDWLADTGKALPSVHHRILPDDAWHWINNNVYLAQSGGLLKVGRSALPAMRIYRMRSHVQTGTPWVGLVQFHGHMDNEQTIHHLLAQYRVHPFGGRERELFLWCHETRRLVEFMLAEQGAELAVAS